jgi:predicted permease
MAPHLRVLREWAARLRGSLRRGRSDYELEEELRLHLELAAADARARGHTPAEAAREARVRAGQLVQAAEALRAQQGLPWFDDLARDLRYAFRTLRRSPAFTAIVLLTLTVGIGANAAVYQLLDAIRLRELPVRDPQQLVILDLRDHSRWNARRTTGYPALTNPLWEEFRRQQHTFSGVLAWSTADFHFAVDAGLPAARGLFVSGEFFNVLGIQPLLGRVFTDADDHAGCGIPGAVVSYGFWQRHLAGDPAAVGRTLPLGAGAVQVIGVAPRGFTGVEVGEAFDLAVPICAQDALGQEAGWLEDGTLWWLTVMGRMPADLALERANGQLEALSPGLFQATMPPAYAPEDARNYLGFTLHAVPGGSGVSWLRTRYGDPLVVLLITTGLVLLIACTNLANLILARAAAREREFAVRLAIGASWGRLARQIMVENALLALAGAAAGLACASALSRALLALLGTDLSLDLPLDARLIAFVAALAVITCLTFGLLPAWRMSKVAAQDAMKASARTAAGSREGAGLRRALVVSQVALSLVLLFGALIFTSTLLNLLAVDAGFQSDDVVIARVDFARASIPPERRGPFKREVLERLRGIAGVSSAAEVRHVPMGGTGSSIRVRRDGGGEASQTAVRLNAMSDGYLQAMRINLIAGRDFDARDTGTSPRVAIVNQSFARRLGLGGNPVGQTFRSDGSSSEPPTVFEIVGLAPDTKYFRLREDFLPIVFVPIAQIEDPRAFTDFVIHAPALPPGMASSVRRAVADLSPAARVDLRTFDAQIRAGLLRERLMAALSALFGTLALLIATIGLYGVMSYLVVRRTKEIGVRIALGARGRDILAMVLREAGHVLAAGLAIGSLLALAGAQAAQSLVFGVRPYDIGPVALACVFLAAAALAASYVPARRAAGMEPLAALRDE